MSGCCSVSGGAWEYCCNKECVFSYHTYADLAPPGIRNSVIHAHIGHATQTKTLELQTRSTDEVRVTDPETGGVKGSKPEDFSLIDQEFLAEMARVLNQAVASGKYEPYNWRKGYRWSLSFSSLWRHTGWRFWKKKESRDLESGMHHMAHAAVHCMFMYVFDTEGLGTDDRV